MDATSAERIALRKIFQIKTPVDSLEDGIDRELSEVGLDVTYWSEVFRNQLDVKSPQALQHVGDESYQILAKFVNQPWEKKALCKLLKMESVESSFKMQNEKQRMEVEERQVESVQLLEALEKEGKDHHDNVAKGKVEERQAESAQLLEALKILEKEGKDRHDNIVKGILGKIRERLQIPEEVWLKEDTTLSQAIAQMEAMLGDTSGALKTRGDLSDLSVIERASGGLALRGVLITTNPNDATELRQPLLKIPKDIHLDSPFDSQHEKIQQFSSKRKEDEFSKRFKGLGYSASASAKAGFWGVTFEASAGYSKNTEKETTEEHHHEETYCSVVKYSVMPMASCSFKDHQLQFSEAALTHLQRIDRELETNAAKSIQTDCEDFFQKFGSHACIGPLHFGGTFTWKCYSSGFKESERSTVQELQSEAIAIQVSMSYGSMASATSVPSIKGKFTGKYPMALISKTFMEVTINGGPPHVTGLLDWKKKLVASNVTWQLIDRGTQGVAVWDIIKRNCASHFKNCSHFVRKLKDALYQGAALEGRTSPQKGRPLSPFKNEKEMKIFFRQLHLETQFPQKLSISHGLMIREDTLEVSIKTKVDKKGERGDEQVDSLCFDPHSYPFLILQKIMAFDHRCRIALVSESRNESDSDSSDEDEDDTEAMVHPMDGLLALLHCCDNFLRKDLMSRLATCQLAVPLLLPDPITKKPTFLLWALRSIIMELQNFNNTVSYAGPIVHYPSPIISFLRLGKHSISKSGLLNAVASPSNHDTFFHYDCAGGRARKVLVNGLVEVSWYLPSKNDKRLPDAITFANLHGNASEYPEQVEFLRKVSCMLFVFLNEGDLDDYTVSILKQLSEAPGGIVVLQTQSSSGLKQKLKQSVPEEKMSIIKLSTKNKHDMRVSIHKRINSKLNTNVPLALEDCRKVACDCGIEIDEDDPQCAKGRKLADEFFKHVNEFKKSNLGSSPKKLLVLQGKHLWHKYGEAEKEQYRHMLKGQLSMYEYSGLQQDKMNQIRKRQLAQSRKPSPLMSSFLNSLLASEGEITWYYLHWLKIYLDDLSRELLPPLHRDYQKKRMELNTIQKQEKKDEAAEEKCRFEMNQLNMQLIDASFGPEHLFREIGQLYEAVMSQTDAQEDLRRKISRLPEITAQLLFDGFPLELMDGDAAHVPLQWVTNVLEKLSELLEKKKVGPSTPQVFVLSVLGLQSTGKSTMLNTIFGVQFSVSAGRCTRGAFMQLLPVHESLQKRCGFQYFLLIDTEGLRAPELDALKMQKHDNELATFVIGLANLTIINIKGEISGDMNDVLQTAVHAFLRMNEVKLRPSCHFSYQNEPAVTAGEKAMQGRLKVKDKLDAMTKEAAEQTGLQGSFQYFSDVFTFDYEKDISFFPDLWTGSPPMAHVSEFYSVEAQTLKHYLIKGVEQNQRSRNHSLLQLKEHLGELWKAILQENFVFSFKNTYEIAEYTKLEEEYSEWSRSFKKQMDDWERTAHSELMGCLLEKLKDEYQRKKDELPNYVKAVYEKLEGKVNTYFDKSTAQDIIAKWKDDIASDLQHLRKKLERHASEKFDILFNARNSLLEYIKKRPAREASKFESLGSKIIEHVQQVASTLERGRLSEKQLEKKFEESWIGWMTELAPTIEQIIKPPNIKYEVENSVRQYQTLKAHYKLLIQKLTLPDPTTGKPKQWGMHLELKVRPVHLKVLMRTGQYLSIVTKARLTMDAVAGSHSAVEPFIFPAQEKTKIVFTEVKKWLTMKKDSGEDFKPNFTIELLDLLFLNITKDPSDRYDFQPEYIVEMALTACGYAQKIFEEMSEIFCQKHDPLVYIETELKEVCWKQFKDNYYNGKGSDWSSEYQEY